MRLATHLLHNTVQQYRTTTVQYSVKFTVMMNTLTRGLDLAKKMAVAGIQYVLINATLQNL